MTQNGIDVFPPMQSLFVIPFQPQFRGTVQPATAYSDDRARAAGDGRARVLRRHALQRARTRPFAPPVPPFPCRSSFDSILYALGAQSGLAAYNLAFGNAYQIFQDSRIVAALDAGGSWSLGAGEGRRALEDRPADPGPAAHGSVAVHAGDAEHRPMVAGPGVPQPTVRFGSTVCQ